MRNAVQPSVFTGIRCSTALAVALKLYGSPSRSITMNEQCQIVRHMYREYKRHLATHNQFTRYDGVESYY